MTAIRFPHLNKTNTAIALVEGQQAYSYAHLNHRIDCLASALLNQQQDLREERIALLVPASLNYVTALHGVWRAGGIAVPLNIAATIPELEYYLSSTGVTRLLTAGEDPADLCDLCTRLNIQRIAIDAAVETAIEAADSALPSADLLIEADRRAMILFTSGTTNKPKGVVTTHKTLAAQIGTLIDAWCWRDDDVIPLFLPLHHIHGIINILGCGLWAGATVHLFPKFDLPSITADIAAERYSVFMAVPTVYVKLLQHFEQIGESASQPIYQGFRRMRLNVCGSAACPVKLFEQWQALTGQTLLERYGMTEIGMALSNPYHAERRAGHVGQVLPGVEVQLVDDNNQPVSAENTPGEIRIKGDSVFLEYWNQPEATRKSFQDGWFCSGDIAVIEAGYYRIMGRANIDIIKSGGYKLSALEIEGVLLTHDAIAECAVVGVEDDVWGESVMAFMVLKPGAELDYQNLKHWSEGKMSAYKAPKAIHVMDALPRNAMGKVLKPELKKWLVANPVSAEE